MPDPAFMRHAARLLEVKPLPLPWDARGPDHAAPDRAAHRHPRARGHDTAGRPWHMGAASRREARTPPTARHLFPPQRPRVGRAFRQRRSSRGRYLDDDTRGFSLQLRLWNIASSPIIRVPACPDVRRSRPSAAASPDLVRRRLMQDSPCSRPTLSVRCGTSNRPSAAPAASAPRWIAAIRAPPAA